MPTLGGLVQRAWSSAGGQTNADGTSMLLNVSSTTFFLPARHPALFSARLLVLINAGGQLGSGDQKGFVYNEAIAEVKLRRRPIGHCSYRRHKAY